MYIGPSFKCVVRRTGPNRVEFKKDQNFNFDRIT